MDVCGLGVKAGVKAGLQRAGQRDSFGGRDCVCSCEGGLSGRVGPHWRDELAV